MQQKFLTDDSVDQLPQSQPLPVTAPLANPSLLPPNVVPVDPFSGSFGVTQQIQERAQLLGYDSDGNLLEDSASDEEPQQDQQASMLVDNICEAAANLGGLGLSGVQAVVIGTGAVASGLNRASHALIGVATEAVNACMYAAHETPAVVSSIASSLEAANVFAAPISTRSPPKRMMTRQRRQRIILEKKEKLTPAPIRKSRRSRTK